MSAVLAALMLLTTVPAPPWIGTFDCAFDKLGLLRGTDQEWQSGIVADFGARTPPGNFSIRLTRDVPGQPVAVIDSPGDPMRIAGRFTGTLLDADQVQVHQTQAAYCPTIDATCAPTVQLFVTEPQRALAIVSMGTYSRGADGKAVARMNFLFSCARRGAESSQ